MEKYTNSENLDFYKKSLESKEFQVIDKFFRLWITKAFSSHLIANTKLHKNFLDKNWEFDLEKYKIMLNYFIVQDVFTKTRTIRYDTVWKFLNNSDIEWIMTQEQDNFSEFWSSIFTEQLAEFTFSDIYPINMWDFDIILYSNITNEELDKVDKWLIEYFSVLNNETIDLIVENKKDKDISEIKDYVIKKITKTILK